MKDDTISRAAAIEAFAPYAEYESNRTNAEWVRRINMVLSALPSAQPEPEEFEWCHTCREYDQEKHCCHRWTKVIRKTVDDMKAAQRGWIPCTTETMPKNKSNVLTVIYIPGRQAHIRSGWYEDGLFMNDNGDTWKATDKEVVGWMYQPKLPKPWEGDANG